MKSPSKKIVVNLLAKEHIAISELLAANCRLSKIKIKDALAKGAVQLKRNRHKQKRIRKAKYMLFPGDSIRFCYDENILNISPPHAFLLHEDQYYSLWYKPSGLLSQGSQYGDHCAIECQAREQLGYRKDIKVVHRLDREVSGLLLLAHGTHGAAELSKLFQGNRMEKKYFGLVAGKMGEIGDKFDFDQDIDGKKALTRAEILAVSPEGTKLDIAILTGRKHQIRKHLSAAGFPLIGDKKYGFCKSSENIRLIAYSLKFLCPFSGKKVEFTLQEKFIEGF